jgi:hypothetical protein
LLKWLFSTNHDRVGVFSYPILAWGETIMIDTEAGKNFIAGAVKLLLQGVVTTVIIGGTIITSVVLVKLL